MEINDVHTPPTPLISERERNSQLRFLQTHLYSICKRQLLLRDTVQDLIQLSQEILQYLNKSIRKGDYRKFSSEFLQNTVCTVKFILIGNQCYKTFLLVQFL